MMTKLIKSRYGVNRLITEEADGSLTIEGESLFYRCSGNEKDLEMFDFEGGPFYCVDFDFHGIGTVLSVTIPCQEEREANCFHEPTVLVTVRLSSKGKKEIKKWQKENYG
jgi:hypothetical protein